MRRLASLVMLVLIAAASLGAGSAQARLDPSFGDGGVLQLMPPAPSGWAPGPVNAIAVGADGQVFVIDPQYRQGGVGSFVFNYLADGTLNGQFGGSRGYEVPTGVDVSEPVIAVASSGLPVVAEQGVGTIFLQRLLSSGAPDAGFGTGGTAVLDCGCTYGELQVFGGPENSLLVVKNEGLNAETGAAGAATVFKLDPYGLRAKGYGKGGSVKVNLRGKGIFQYEALAPGGATYFGEAGEPSDTYQGTLIKVSASGKVIGSYAKEATHALGRLLELGGGNVTVLAAVAAKDGTMKLFGSWGESKGFELKLRASGALESRFANRGVRIFNRQITAAVGGSEGSTMALASGSSTRIVRILADGKLDPAFGISGEELPGLAGEGISLSPTGAGRVSVIDLDREFCRQGCDSHPKVYRFLEH